MNNKINKDNVGISVLSLGFLIMIKESFIIDGEIRELCLTHDLFPMISEEEQLSRTEILIAFFESVVMKIKTDVRVRRALMVNRSESEWIWVDVTNAGVLSAKTKTNNGKCYTLLLETRKYAFHID